MATTVQTILEAAWASRTANDPDSLAKSRELMLVLRNFMQWLSGRVAQWNARYLAAWSLEIVPAGGVWAPTDPLAPVLAAKAGTGGAAKVLAAGTEIHIGQRDDPDAVLTPAIYREGAGYKSFGRAGDPNDTATGDKILFLAPTRFTAIDHTGATSQTLDARWPDAYNGLLSGHLAHYLARKDGRTGDLAAFAEENQLLLAGLEADLRQLHIGEAARFGQVPRTTPTAATVNG